MSSIYDTLRALQIDSIEELVDGKSRLIGKCDGVTYTVDASDQYMRRHRPEVGGFFLQYPNGHEEFKSEDDFHDLFVRSAKSA